MSKISEKIAERRKALGMSQETLANMIGVTNQSVSKWENDLSMPDIALVPSLCGVLKISADELFGIEPADNTDSLRSAVKRLTEKDGAVKTSASLARMAMDGFCGTQMTAFVSGDGVLISDLDEITALVINGKEQLNALQNVPFDTVKSILGLLCDESVYKVIGVLDFDEFQSAGQIAKKCKLSLDDVNGALLKLLGRKFCECDINGNYSFAVCSYNLFAVLLGLWYNSPRGGKAIASCSISHNNR